VKDGSKPPQGHHRGDNGWPAGATAADVWSEAGRARALANLSPDAAITHGLSRYLSRSIAPPCKRCAAREECEEFRDGATCIIAERHQAQIVRDLRALPHLGDVDLPLVHEYAKVATAICIADTYLSRTGPLLPGDDKGLLEYQPAMKERLKLSERLEKLAGTLGLTPVMRAKLAAQQSGPASALAAALKQLEQQRAPQPAETLEGQFTTEEDTPGGQAADEEEA